MASQASHPSAKDEIHTPNQPPFIENIASSPAPVRQIFGIPLGYGFAVAVHVTESKCCVYVLQSVANPTRYYTGVTSNWRTRLEAHNNGACVHTTRHRPWKIDVVVQFTDERRALAFERYLKSGSGGAFAKHHLR